MNYLFKQIITIITTIKINIIITATIIKINFRLSERENEYIRFLLEDKVFLNNWLVCQFLPILQKVPVFSPEIVLGAVPSVVTFDSSESSVFLKNV